MKLHELAPAVPTKKAWRKGRGPASGNGKTGGRGHKGQQARSGGGVRIGFEGGQMPAYRRLPKRGFNNARFATEFAIVNLSVLDKFFEDGAVVDLVALVEANIITKPLDGLKVLGNGNITKKITVKAHKVSDAAKAKIEAAGGTVEVI
jgi:large subunit ribosomal protein L15